MDTKEDAGIGEIRGVIDRVCNILSTNCSVEINLTEKAPWLEPGGEVMLNGNFIGRIGRLAAQVQKNWNLPSTVHVAQLYLGTLLASYPPEVQSHALPSQPAIVRDISLIIDESVQWSAIQDEITLLHLEHLENVSFVTTFRSKNIGDGKKSLTLKLRFRDSNRTLTHEEADEPTTTATTMLINKFDAEIRS
jgi:phenylalanyl-tRNA synthetase beta chain